MDIHQSLVRERNREKERERKRERERESKVESLNFALTSSLHCNDPTTLMKVNTQAQSSNLSQRDDSVAMGRIRSHDSPRHWLQPKCGTQHQGPN